MRLTIVFDVDLLLETCKKYHYFTKISIQALVENYATVTELDMEELETLAQLIKAFSVTDETIINIANRILTNCCHVIVTYQSGMKMEK